MCCTIVVAVGLCSACIIYKDHSSACVAKCVRNGLDKYLESLLFKILRKFASKTGVDAATSVAAAGVFRRMCVCVCVLCVSTNVKLQHLPTYDIHFIYTQTSRSGGSIRLKYAYNVLK